MFRTIRWNQKGASAVGGRPNLLHQVAGRIGSLIGEGRLVPGAVLPNESELGSKFGVSRTVLREAIKVLASKGLVEVRRKTGTRVRPHTEWNLFDPEVLSWSFSGEGVPAGLQDLLEVRKVAEPAAARMAAERAKPEDLAALEKAYRSMKEVASDLSASIGPDLEFHLGVLTATHNIFMRSFGTLIQTALYASFRFTSTNRAAYQRTLPLHRNVLDAIKSGASDRAGAAMEAVLRQTSQDIEKKLRPVQPKTGSQTRRGRV